MCVRERESMHAHTGEEAEGKQTPHWVWNPTRVSSHLPTWKIWPEPNPSQMLPDWATQATPINLFLKIKSSFGYFLS